MLKEFDINIDLEGQDVVGLAIANTTDNWSHFPRGMNFIIQDKFEEGRKLSKEYRGNISLLHYIHMNKNNQFYKNAKVAFNNVRKNYYS